MECSGNLGKWFCSNKSQTFRPTFLSLSFLRTATFLITWCCFCSLLTLTSAEKPLIDFQATIPRKVEEGQSYTLVVSAIVGQPANMSCITKMLPIRSPKWRKKVQIGNDIKWEEMDKNCIEKMDEEAAIEETKWLSKRSSKEKPPKCFIFNVSLADGSRNVTIFFPILKEEDLGDYSCGITSDPIEHAKTDAMVTLEAVNVRVKREKAQTIKRDPAIQYELPNKTYIDISAHRKFKGSVSSLTVVEGETALIFCDLSWPGPEERRSIHGHGYHVRWFKDDIHIQYTDDPEGIRRITTNKTQTLITLGNANLTDRGMYRCDILDKDDNKIASFQYQVRVRSKVAALWPFIAICVEVAIICLIILIYEKTKSKAEIADSDTDGSPDHQPRQGKM